MTQTVSKKVKSIVAAIKDYFKKSGMKKAVLGLSGGVDSSLVAKLAVMALGRENVTALILPNFSVNNPLNVRDAEKFCKTLGIRFYKVPINGYLDNYENLPWKAMKFAKMNVQARVRANILYHFANSNQALVLGTGNKTEIALGYFTKYGDGACDVLPIGSLYKTEVWEAAKLVGIPKEIIEKVPSAELVENQTDEGEIGVQYAEMDEILKKFEKGKKMSTESAKTVHKWVAANRHKNDMPVVL